MALFSMLDPRNKPSANHVKKWWTTLTEEEKHSTNRLLDWNLNKNNAELRNERAREGLLSMSVDKKAQHSKNTSNAVKEIWKDPIQREKRLAGLAKASAAKKNKEES